MASVKIDYTCGCGFRTRSLEAAVEHSDDEHHSLVVLGEIRYEKPKAQYTDTTPVTDFAALRKKLGKG